MDVHFYYSCSVSNDLKVFLSTELERRKYEMMLKYMGSFSCGNLILQKAFLYIIESFKQSTVVLSKTNIF